MKANWNKDFFNTPGQPYTGMVMDCADAVYSMRIIYAAQNARLVDDPGTAEVVDERAAVLLEEQLLAELERLGVVSGVITQNVDLLHTKAGSANVINLHGTYARVICLVCGATMERAALADELEALNPGFLDRAGHVGGIAVAPDADAVVTDTATFRYRDCPRCGGMLKPDIVYFGESVAKTVVEQAYSLVDASEALLVAGSSLTVFSGYRFVRHAAARGIPVGIINRGRTRGDDLATVKVDAGCSELLTLLAGELVPVSYH